MPVVKHIPDNIRRIRASKGLTQEQVAQEAGITRTAFGSIENAASEPRVSTLHGISRALGVSLSELLAEPPMLSTVRFRSKKLQASKEKPFRDQVVIEVARWLKSFNGLEELLGQEKEYALMDLGNKVRKLKLGTRPKQAAEEARESLGLSGGEPIRDICGLLESAGVKVHTLSLDVEDLFGLSVGPSDGGPAIVVNVREDITVERRIFTAAHELGHLLLHPGAYDVSKFEEDMSQEKEADRFASYFLMPNEVFLKEWNDTSGLYFVDRVLRVKRVFRVSYMTVLYRLTELGLADQKKVWMLFKAECKRKYGVPLTKKYEPYALVEAEAKLEPKRLDDLDFVEDRLSGLVRTAIEAEKITLSRGAEILGLGLAEMREWAISWEVAA